MQQNHFTQPQIWDYCLHLTSALSEDLDYIKQRTEREVHGAQMLSDRVVAKLLQMFVYVSQARLCVDIGTYTGFSALAMAEAIGDEGKIITIDRKNQAGHKVACEAFARAEHGYKISMIIDDALHAIDELPNGIDIAFIDADKKQTQQYVERILPKLSNNGMIIVDDVLWRGEVIAPKDERAQKLDIFNREMCQSEDIENVLLPIRHGLHLIRKKA